LFALPPAIIPLLREEEVLPQGLNTEIVSEEEEQEEEKEKEKEVLHQGVNSLT